MLWDQFHGSAFVPPRDLAVIVDWYIEPFIIARIRLWLIKPFAVLLKSVPYNCERGRSVFLQMRKNNLIDFRNTNLINVDITIRLGDIWTHYKV